MLHRPAMTYILNSNDAALGLNHKKFGPCPMPGAPQAYVREFYDDITQAWTDSEQDRAVLRRRLAAKGSYMFTALFPEPLQQLLWRLRERIRSVRVQSEEPWVPWELCRLQGTDTDGRVQEAGFLCQEFDVTRWIPGVPLVSRLSCRRMGVVMTGGSGLANAAQERDELLALATDERTVEPIEARYLDVMRALCEGAHDAWHFIAHGYYRADSPDHSGIILENDKRLRAEDLSGEVRNLGAHHRPLVFMNACSVGRTGFSLTGIGSWAAQFLRARAGAFIGSYWAIADPLARRFANVFYRQLLAGAPIGESARAARQAAREVDEEDPTWLAYTVYADPVARVT